MKIKKTMTDFTPVKTMLTMDINGGVTIDGPNKFLNYDSNRISLCSQGRTIYIKGKDMKISSYSKNNISISGKIEKIELFGVEDETKG